MRKGRTRVNSYKTILEFQRTKIAVGACRFFASLAPCASEGAARQFLGQVKAALPGARHHAFALRIGQGERVLSRCDDAGEPAGTAGPPMLSVLEKHDLTDLVLVGSRYFGGVKLGIGGLIRAYRACAEAGIAEATITTREIMQQVTLVIPYDFLGAVVRELESAGGEARRFLYEEEVTLESFISWNKLDDCLQRIQSVTKGQARVSINGARTSGEER